jgi:hypothetical protein
MGSGWWRNADESSSSIRTPWRLSASNVEEDKIQDKTKVKEAGNLRLNIGKWIKNGKEM